LTRKKVTGRGLLLLIIVLVTSALIWFLINENSRNWTIEEIFFRARDGFDLSAFLLRPVKPGSKKYPSVACFHQLSGNRDDFLDLFPLLAKKGIIALAPNFVRQRADLSSTRITDLKDTLAHLDSLEFTEKGKTGIITASFTVETGMYAIRNNPDVIANVIISGPILREKSRRWLTRNTNLAIFNIASIIDGNHYLLMEEYTQRSLNPLSRNLIIEKKEAPFTLPAHGTFVFDEIPEIRGHIADFFGEVFGIEEEAGGVVINPVPENMITFYSTDRMPIHATYVKPAGNGKAPAILMYPPESETRLYYSDLIRILTQRGIAVLAPNTKRACRKKTKINLCDMEVNGAIQHLQKDPDIDPRRIAVLFPGFYHYFAVKAVNNSELPAKLVLLMNFDRYRDFIDPERLGPGQTPAVKFLQKPDKEKILFYLMKYLNK